MTAIQPNTNLYDYDIIVIGAGHAGCEAASAAARMGSRTLLLTMDMQKMASMSCNPAVGGVAKGQIVREIDALGGCMGRITDHSTIQFRMLNRSKGAAMWSPRAQCDKELFSRLWRRELENTENLFIWQDSATELHFQGEGNKRHITGVSTRMGVRFTARAVILTAGTFLTGLMHCGEKQAEGGRAGDSASYGITESLRELGFEVGRMKTGTPARIDGRSIDFSVLEEQPGDENPSKFSFSSDTQVVTEQKSCYLVYTSPQVHALLRFSAFPVMDEEAARFLVSCGMKGVGTDAISVDPVEMAHLPVHRVLLGAGMVIVENLRLQKLAGERRVRFYALPLKYRNADGAPVRAVAEIPDGSGK